MPGRDIPLVTDQIYHIVNRGVASQPIFRTKWEYRRFLESMWFYQYIDTPVRYSRFLYLSNSHREDILTKLDKRHIVFVEIIAFCFMPTHFHFLLRQRVDSGISKFISNLSNSYTRYFNTKYKRTGPLLQGKFKAVYIMNDNQLLHVVRYIHLNPYTSYVVKKISDLSLYPYSSLTMYLSRQDKKKIDATMVLGHFKSRKSFEKFTFDQADYQRELEKIKHLLLEK